MTEVYATCSFVSSFKTLQLRWILSGQILKVIWIHESQYGGQYGCNTRKIYESSVLC